MRSTGAHGSLVYHLPPLTEPEGKHCQYSEDENGVVAEYGGELLREGRFYYRIQKRRYDEYHNGNCQKYEALLLLRVDCDLCVLSLELGALELEAAGDEVYHQVSDYDSNEKVEPYYDAYALSVLQAHVLEDAEPCGGIDVNERVEGACYERHVGS